MSEILITVAIPTYNNEKTIGDTIVSCLNQETDVAYEVLVVNNASKDGTKQVIESYMNDPKLKYAENDHTVTLYENHNACLEHANGRYVIFCHSDDRLESHAVETFARKIDQRNYPKKYILFGHSMFRDFSIYLNNGGFHLNEMIAGETAPMLFMYSGLTPSGTCFSKDSLLELNGFLRTEHRLAAGDMTSMLYYALKGFRFEMTDEMIYNRTFASTAVEGRKLQDTLDSVDEAFEHFFKEVTDSDIEKLLKVSVRLKQTPLLLYFAIAKKPLYKGKVAQVLWKEIVKNPLLLSKKMLYRTMKRIYA
jgi:glycosyltransferase involved in cell wall biosynthesis